MINIQALGINLVCDLMPTPTCNDQFIQIFTYLNSDNAQLAQYLISSFDLYTIEDKAAKDVWSLQVLAMQISLQNPFLFFGIDEFEKNQNNNQFFYGDKSDPRLRLGNQCVGFWLICSEMFDYPWATTFDDDYYNELPLSIIRGIKQKLFQSFFRPESSTHHIQHAIQKNSDPMNDNLDNAVGHSHLNKTTLVDQRKCHRNLTDNRYDALVDDDGSIGENADNAKAADNDATTIDGNAYQQPNQDNNDNEILVTAPLSSDDEDDGDDDDNKDDDAVSNAGVKPDFPFAAPATFISDWKSAQQKPVSAKTYGLVKDATLTLISKLHDYYILTEVLYLVMDLPGMLKFATTTMFGSCTLFKLLLLTKTTPAQANKASHSHQSTTETDDSDND
ncbi:unnamed protein product [Cylindrotheca closterium]|uniref:Uncharacterized protein n=1 Tax=Cylindrotheca closterium TaxID=2856 RepID=A0AAD2FM16_9STRA|nr:unnamed protein product [Cylindrotheca closterium]CAJ1950929.1 unnamed protein product [Cylindrotheca closterium]